MKTTMKKVLSMTLALVLLLGVLPMTTLAAEKPTCFVIANGTHTHSSGCTIEAHNSYDDTNAVACVDANSSGYCDVCWGAMPVAHTCTGGTAYCNARAYCEVCGEQYGTVDTNNHRGADSTGWNHNGNTHYKVCAGCSAQLDSGAHSWTKDSCTSRSCGTCGRTETIEEHTWIAADCNNPRTCSVCDATEGAAAGHSWIDANCTTPKTCRVCGTTEGSAVPHNWIDATCTVAKTCSVCGATEGSALGHDWRGNATNCRTCGTAYNAVPRFTVYYNVNVNNPASISLGDYDSNTPMSTVLARLNQERITYPGSGTPDWFYIEGWYKDKACTQKVDPASTVTENTTLYAKWLQKQRYAVTVWLCTNGNFSNAVPVDAFYFAQDGWITQSEVENIANNKFKAGNSAGLTIYGPFDAAGWENYRYYNNRLNASKQIQIDTTKENNIYAMVHNVEIYSSSSTSGSKADSTNPKTGDMIMMPAAVLGLSASALAVMFYLKKKRAY